MSSKPFVHLHNHSEYSPDGAGTIKAMVTRAKEIGCPALAITDHGTLAGAVSFWAACKDVGIKPIIGLEGYLLHNGKRHHITLNSYNKVGFNNLIALSNRAHQRYTSGYPLMVLEDFEQFREGLVVLTGCPASAIHAGEYSDGLQFVSNLKDIFGKENVFAEVMFVMSTDFVSRPFRIAKELGLPVLITNDSHFHTKDQAKSHKIITECRKGYNYESHQLWLKSYEEMEQTGLNLFHPSYVETWLGNTMMLAERVESWSMYADPELPKTVGAADEIRRLLVEAFARDSDGRAETDIKVRKERLNYEFKMLKSMGFMDYTFILTDVIGKAHELGVRVGPGRGSAAGSYVLYLLGITGVDPVKYDLMFERYINPARKSYPDVDVDFESERRHEVLEYAAKRWGALPVATYTHYSHKTAVQDIGRVLNIPRYICDEAAASETDSAEFSAFTSAHPDVLVTYNTMIGQVKNKGKHAGGIIITAVPVPIESNGKEHLVAWTEGKEKQVTKAGIVKFDFLGLTALSQLQTMVELLGEEPGDPETDVGPYEIFRSGDVAGIFQWTGSDGIRTLTVKIGPESIEELAVINSLFRPGALDAGTAKAYPEYKASPRKIDDRIDDILKGTSGVIVFQEQVMAIFARVVGGNLADADLARRVIVKARRWDPEWLKELDALKADFLARGAANGYEVDLLEHLWSELMTHSRYCLGPDTLMHDHRTILEWYVDGPPLQAPALDLATGKVFMDEVLEVVDRGFNETFELELEDGSIIECTAGHRFWTSDGWKQLSELKEGDSIWAAKQQLKVKSIRPKRSVRTFTVTMAGKDHNYITADGVVHANSFNKCLIGSTKVVRSAAGPYGGNQITLDELHAAWHSATAHGSKLRRDGVTLLQMDEDGRIRPGKCIGVYYQGKKPVYKVKISNGGRIVGTANHRLLTTEGYKQIDELVPGVTELICVGAKDTGYSKKFDYEKGERKGRWSKGRPTVPLKVVSVTYFGEEDTFDVEMDTPGHNFLANGIVSHNSHSLAYAWIAYQMAWFKHYYPEIFYIGILRHDSSGAQTFLLEAAAKGIRIMPPHVNHSSHMYEYRDGAIYLPLSAVSHLGENGAKAIHDERVRRGPFKSYKDFDDRVETKWCNSRARRFLYRLGGMSDLAGHPGDAIRHLDEIEPASPAEVQLELLGYVLPTKLLARRMKRAEENGLVIGFVQSYKDKSSAHGSYRVFKLSPHGSFWAREGDDAHEIEKGELVEGKKMRSGRVKKVERIAL